MSDRSITTHILDTSTGLPAQNVPVQLLKLIEQQWQLITHGTTNNDGRITDWLTNKDDIQPIEFGTYKLIFDLDSYCKQQNMSSFYPCVEICFRLQDERHHHIPLLLSAFGYSTYRGS
jgi:5-hydroxyisourate hydrolase